MAHGILYCGIRCEDRIGFQRTRNTIACLQIDHAQRFESTTDRFALQLCSEFNWKYGQIGLLGSLCIRDLFLIYSQFTAKDFCISRLTEYTPITIHGTDFYQITIHTAQKKVPLPPPFFPSPPPLQLSLRSNSTFSREKSIYLTSN